MENNPVDPRKQAYDKAVADLRNQKSTGHLPEPSYGETVGDFITRTSHRTFRDYFSPVRQVWNFISRTNKNLNIGFDRMKEPNRTFWFFGIMIPVQCSIILTHGPILLVCIALYGIAALSRVWYQYQ